MPGGFGLPTMGTVPTAALDSLLPWLSYLPDLAKSLATTQYQGQNALQQAQIAANANMFGDSTRANATIGAAQIGAGATIESQQIQTRGMLQALQAQIETDLQKQAMGDTSAAARLKASLQQQAELKNTDTALTLAKMMGSGQLRDSIGARLALRGMGTMPGVSSALNGLENRIWADTNRNVDMPGAYTVPKVNMSVGGGGSYGGANLSGMNFGGSFGGGTGAIANSNLGGQYADLFNQLKGTVNFGDIFKFGNTPAPLGSVNPSGGTPRSTGAPTGDINILPTDPNYAKTIGNLNDYFGINAARKAASAGTPTMDPSASITWQPPQPPVDPGFTMWDPALWERAARGGKFKNQAALVGDSPSGSPTGVEELVVGKDFQVIPLHRAAFGYDPSVSDPTYDERKKLYSAGEYTDPSLTDPDYERNKTLGATPAEPIRRVNPPSTRPAIQTYDPRDPMYADRSFTAPAAVYGAGNQPSAERIGMKNLRSSRPMSNLPSKKFGTPADGAASPTAPAAPNTPQTQPTGGVTINVGGGQPSAPLADVNNIPALQQLRTGNVLPAFGDMPTLAGEPGLGITDTPAPYLRSATFNAMSPAEQEDVLQWYEFRGVPRQVALYQMAQATPGFRMNPTRAFGF